MTEALPETTYLSRMRAARQSVAVLKYRLAHLRSHLPSIPVFAFEGTEDKIIYYHWIRRVKPELNYEPFPCTGKRQVFALREMLYRDLGELKNGVFYFIDRDFDGLMGEAEDDATFITDQYSTENYLVCEAVLNELLRNEFHCHGRPDVRQPILDRFSALYSDFLNVTKPLNRKLYIAKTCGIGLLGYPPEKLNHVALVSLEAVTPTTPPAEEAVIWEREPTLEEIENRNAAFNALDPRSHYRGKYALRFFEKWLLLLAEEYAADFAGFFRNMRRSERVKQSEVTLGSFAAKSPLPAGFIEFISRVQ